MIAESPSFSYGEYVKRVLTHISKRRGYKSNRKSLEEKDTKSDNGKALGGII